MDITSTVHPKIFIINGFSFQVVSDCRLTDIQAGKIARHFYRTHRIKMEDQGKVHQVHFQMDQDSLGLL